MKHCPVNRRRRLGRLGQTTTEYTLILALITLTGISIMETVGNTLRDQFDTVNDVLDEVMNNVDDAAADGSGADGNGGGSDDNGGITTTTTNPDNSTTTTTEYDDGSSTSTTTSADGSETSTTTTNTDGSSTTVTNVTTQNNDGSTTTTTTVTETDTTGSSTTTTTTETTGGTAGAGSDLEVDFDEVTFNNPNTNSFAEDLRMTALSHYTRFANNPINTDVNFPLDADDFLQILDSGLPFRSTTAENFSSNFESLTSDGTLASPTIIVLTDDGTVSIPNGRTLTNTIIFGQSNSLVIDGTVNNALFIVGGALDMNSNGNITSTTVISDTGEGAIRGTFNGSNTIAVQGRLQVEANINTPGSQANLILVSKSNDVYFNANTTLNGIVVAGEDVDIKKNRGITILGDTYANGNRDSSQTNFTLEDSDGDFEPVTVNNPLIEVILDLP